METEWWQHEWFKPDWLTAHWVCCKVCGTVKLAYATEFSCPGPLEFELSQKPDGGTT